MIYFIVSGIAALLFLFVYVILTVFKRPKVLSKIWEAVQAGDTRDSIRELKSIMMKQGGSVDTHFLLAECYRREGNVQMAIVEYRYCLNSKKKPSFAQPAAIRNGLVECYLKLDKEDDALIELLELLKEDPNNADYLLKTAKLFYNRGNLEQAVTYFDRTLQKDPANAESLGYLGMIMFQAHQYKEALVYLNRVLKFEPKDSRTHYFLGRLYRESKDWQKALSHFEIAQISPEYRMKTFIQKGYCYKEMNEPESAIDEFKKALLSAKGRDANLLLIARYSLASVYESTAKLADAIEQWEEIYRLNPKYRDVLQKLDQYKDLRGDDNLKDFLVCAVPHFEELCRRIVTHLGLEILELKIVKPSLATAIAFPREADKRAIMRQRIYCKINRDTVNFGVPEIKQIIEEAKAIRCTQAIYISPMSYGKDALEFSTGRQITLIGGKELSGLLGEMNDNREPA